MSTKQPSRLLIMMRSDFRIPINVILLCNLGQNYLLVTKTNVMKFLPHNSIICPYDLYMEMVPNINSCVQISYGFCNKQKCQLADLFQTFPIVK